MGELEDDAKTIPQVESPNKLEEKEKSEVTGEVTKALNEHFEAFNRLSKQHFAEGSDEESDSEDVEMEVDSPIKAAIAVLEERALNLAKMELSSHLTEEIAELEELAVELEEILVEFKEGLSEQTKRKLSAGSPSAKLAGVDKAPKIDEAKPISSTSVGTA